MNPFRVVRDDDESLKSMRLEQLASEINAAVQRSRADFMRIGECLLEARSRFPGDAEFGQWREENTTISKATSMRMMDARKNVTFLRRPDLVEPNVLYLMANNGTKDEQSALIEWANATGEPVTFDDAKRFLKTGSFSNQQLLHSSESNEWYTPKVYLDAARSVLGGIDIDPASCERANFSVGAKEYYTEQTDGLSREWPGTVWLNPPYGDLAHGFITRLIDQYIAGTTSAAIALINSQTHTTEWFKPLRRHAAFCLTDHRIRFYSPAGESSSPTAGSVFVYLGPSRKVFERHFDSFGMVFDEGVHEQLRPE